MTEPVRVFISYAREDRSIAHEVAAQLSSLGIAFFLDEKHVDWGDHIEEAVQRGIRDSSHLLLILSPSSRTSQWCPFEIGLARGYGLTILPLQTQPNLEPLPFLRSLNFKSDLSSIRDYFLKIATNEPAEPHNPKPYAIGQVTVDDVYLMYGNYTSPVPVNVRFVADPLAIPAEVLADYDKLRTQAANRAKRLGAQYFDGPNTRLIRFTEEGTHQLPGGLEQKQVTLELGPVSWEEYTILNTFLDEPLSGGGTMRKLFADRERLFAHDRDFSWCRLSGIISLGITPITSDGFGLVQRRNPRGVSTEGGRYTSGLAENIHRFLDESPRDDVFQRLHELDLPSEVHHGGIVDTSYVPQGVPSPYLATQRGLWEEISEAIAAEIPITAVRFLNIGFELSKFHPVLIGIVELGLSRDEVQRRRRVSPGRDHSEFLDVLSYPLDHRDPQTVRLLADQENWVPGGLAAFVCAIHYWRAQH